MFSSAWEWVCGNGEWATIPQCFNYDRFMVTSIVFFNAAIGLGFAWAAFYWNKYRKISRTEESLGLFTNLAELFVVNGVFGCGLTLLCCWYPPWRLWIPFAVVFGYLLWRVVATMRTGVVFVFKDLQTLRRVREEFKLVETSKMEFDALRDKLCEVRNLVQQQH